MIGAATLMAACGSSAESIDAGPTDAGFSTRLCIPPAFVSDPLVISGTIYAVATSGTSLAMGATVDLRRDADDALLATATVASDGSYQLPGVTTGGKPLAAHARISLAGYAPTLFYVVDGLRSNLLIAQVGETSQYDVGAQTAGVTWVHTNGIVNASVRECNNESPTAGLAGAAVAVVPGSTTTYDDGQGHLSPGPTSTQSPSGGAYDLNVAPGLVAVNLTSNGARTTYNVKSEAGAFTFLIDFP